MKHLPHWVNSFAPQYANSSTSGRPNLCVTRIWYNSLQVTVKKMITFQVKKKKLMNHNLDTHWSIYAEKSKEKNNDGKNCLQRQMPWH